MSAFAAPRKLPPLLTLLLLGSLVLAGCSEGDRRTPSASQNTDNADASGTPESNGGQQGGEGNSPANGSESQDTPSGEPSGGEPAGNEPSGNGNGSSDNAGSNGTFSLRTASRSISIVEGGAAVPVSLTLTRENGFDGVVTLAAEPASEAEAADLRWNFDQIKLASGENTTELQVSLGIGAMPLQPQQRTLRISATDGSSAPAISELVLDIQPTAAPDVYLLVGQSNMVGFSEPDARQAADGQADAPNGRIYQLNPTGNDDSNFATPADFTDGSIVANPTISPAIDPLHDGYDADIAGKDSGFIGPGMSFAKAALADTTAEIVLVPAAWSDTGFCARESNRLSGLGWLPEPRGEAVFAGTLLHDRAIARANLALENTGGVLRGILWHQGEADDAPACAAAYAENLAALATSFRSSIVSDARGSGARGPLADIPFVVGTMSVGTDARGSQLPFGEAKALVDAAHRTVGNSIALSGVVVNDDLQPPAYPCGESSCVHFGAAAQREMGTRYYRVLRSLLETR